MNWSKAKSILILFLLSTSLILTYLLVSLTEGRRFISPQTVEYTISLLNKNGISVSSNLLAKRSVNEHIYNVENVVTDYELFAKTVFPDSVSVDDNTYISQSSNNKITFRGDRFSISFPNGFQTNHRLKSPADKASAYLMSIGIDVSDASVRVSNNADGIFTVTYTTVLGKHTFFDCNIETVLDGENITSVSGTWFNRLDSLATQSELLPLTSLLVNYSVDNPDFKNISISDITLGYSINEYGVYHKQSTVSPVYKVSTVGGDDFFIDARGME